MKEKVLFKVELVVNTEPKEVEKIENKLCNLSIITKVVSFHITKTYL